MALQKGEVARVALRKDRWPWWPCSKGRVMFEVEPRNDVLGNPTVKF